MGSRTEVPNMSTKLISKLIVTMIKRIARRSLNKVKGYELIDLPTSSMGHCLLVSGVPSSLRSSSGQCIELLYQISAMQPTITMTINVRILSSL